MPLARGAKLPEAERSVDIEAPIAVVFDTVVDYARYPSFLDEVVSARHAAPLPDGSAVVEFAVDVVKRFTYRLRISTDPPREVRWDLYDGALFVANRGSWTLQPIGPARTRATYRVDIELDLFVPRAVQNKLMSVTLPQTLDCFRREAERRFRAAGASAEVSP